MVRYLQILEFGEDWYADDIAGMRCAVPAELARLIVGRRVVSATMRRDLADLHPQAFDAAALWRIPLPLELFVRSWSLMCAAAERAFRGRQVTHVAFDRLVSGAPEDELTALGAALRADPAAWCEAVEASVRPRQPGDTGIDRSVDPSVEAAAAVGRAALRRMVLSLPGAGRPPSPVES
jgi:hypothetical protein